MKLVYFSAPWCGPCRMFGPVMDRLAGEGLNIEKVNVDENQQAAMKYGIRSVPTVIKVDSSGEVVDMFVGAKDANFVKQFYNG